MPRALSYFTAISPFDHEIGSFRHTKFVYVLFRTQSSSANDDSSGERVFGSNQYYAGREDLNVIFVPRLANSVAKNELTAEPA